MPYSITTRDGITIQNIPDDEPADSPRLKQRVTEIRSQMNPPPTDRQKTLTSAPMRFIRGMKDPIDGAAQLLQWGAENSPVSLASKALGGPSVAGLLNRAANAIGGEGTFLGDVLGVKGGENMDRDIQQAEQEYQEARKATAPVNPQTGERDPGFDLARLGGNMASPANVIAARLTPALRVGEPVRQLAAKGATGGAVGAGMQPVTGENFGAEKLGQVAAGAAGGAVLGPLLSKVGDSAARFVQRWRNSSNTVNVTPERLREMVRRQLEADGIEATSIPDHVFNRLTDDVRASLAAGRQLDPAAALRQQDFEALNLPALQGQVTRNPAQWQREFNLAGVEGVGEPLQAVMAQQSRGIQGRMQRGAGAALEPFEAGQQLIEAGRRAQQARNQGVSQAYQAFRDATGRDLDVPLQGLAQDYANTLREFGDAIPGAVRKQFEGLGLMSGKQLRSLSIEDAERLIKTINSNTDPKNTVSYRALGELRTAVQNAITTAAGGDDAAAGAAQLARDARSAAAANFRNLESTPALRAAMEGMEPDQFVQRFVIGGKVNEIQRFAQAVGPEGREQMAAQLWMHLQSKAFGANAAGDGKAAQAALNAELRKIGRPKLVALLGEQGADEAMRIGRVLAYIKQVPEGATPGVSGSGQMLASALGKARGLRGLPYVNDWFVQPLERFGQRREVQQALSGAPQQPAQLDPETIKALSALFSPVPVAGGIALGQSVR